MGTWLRHQYAKVLRNPDVLVGYTSMAINDQPYGAVGAAPCRTRLQVPRDWTNAFTR